MGPISYVHTQDRDTHSVRAQIHLYLRSLKPPMISAVPSPASAYLLAAISGFSCSVCFALTHSSIVTGSSNSGATPALSRTGESTMGLSTVSSCGRAKYNSTVRSYYHWSFGGATTRCTELFNQPPVRCEIVSARLTVMVPGCAETYVQLLSSPRICKPAMGCRNSNVTVPRSVCPVSQHASQGCACDRSCTGSGLRSSSRTYVV
jgi:hypothetical protein